MKALKSVGLVPCTVKQDFANYHAGDTVRFSPVDARKYIEAGFITEAKVEKGTEVVPVPEPASELLSGRILPQELPAIPDDWEESHRLQRGKLAEQIKGGPLAAGENADEIIKRELARRLTE